MHMRWQINFAKTVGALSPDVAPLSKHRISHVAAPQERWSLKAFCPPGPLQLGEFGLDCFEGDHAGT